MSYLPVGIVYPRLFSRQVIELWEYQWNAPRQTYERVCFRPLQIMQPEGNPVDQYDEMQLFPPRPILLLT